MCFEGTGSQADAGVEPDAGTEPAPVDIPDAADEAEVPSGSFDQSSPVNITVEDGRTGPQCTVCDKMLEALQQRGSGAEFPVSSISPNREEMVHDNSTYRSFIGDMDVRMRYYVQAHLHWFGYFPEMIGSGSVTTPVSHNNKIGFPRFHVDGKWGQGSKNAFGRFLQDLPAGERTEWTADSDVMREADIHLVRRKCGLLFNRPNFNYYTQYSVTRNSPSGVTSTAIRPFLFRRAYLSRPDPPDGDDRLLEIMREESDNSCEPESPRMGAHPVEADFAPFDFSNISESIRNTMRWPVITSVDSPAAGDEDDYLTDSELLEELTIKGVTAATVRQLYPLYKYTPDRWLVAYRKSGHAGHTHHRDTRPFDAMRDNNARMHGGIDVYADYGDPIRAIMDGRIVAFTNQAPISTCFLFIRHDGLRTDGGDPVTINYGEINHESLIRNGLMVGDDVTAGQIIGATGRMSEMGRSSSMLHFEAYRGTATGWQGVNVPSGPTDPIPAANLNGRMNPTKFLRALRELEHFRMPLHYQWEQQRALGVQA